MVEGGISQWRVVVDLFSRAKVTWKHYVETLPSVPGMDDGYTTRFPDPQTLSLWNVLPAFAKVRNNPGLMANLVSLDEYQRDLSRRTLPQVSWTIPAVLS